MQFSSFCQIYPKCPHNPTHVTKITEYYFVTNQYVSENSKFTLEPFGRVGGRSLDWQLVPVASRVIRHLIYIRSCHLTFLKKIQNYFFNICHIWIFEYLSHLNICHLAFLNIQTKIISWIFVTSIISNISRKLSSDHTYPAYRPQIRVKIEKPKETICPP